MFKRKRLVIALAVLVIAVFCFGVFMRRHYVVPVLMYHSINFKTGPLPESLVVNPSIFERQMRFLREHNYNIVSLGKIAELIKDKKKIPPKTIAVTFDDGYADNYTYAFPVLKKYNIPATIFIIVNMVGNPEGDKLSWDKIKEMQESGLVRFGSHTLDHPFLTEIKSDQELRRQIFGSKKALEEKLGRRVDTFCYPSGNFNEKVRRLVIAAGYKAAVVSNPGKKYPSNDIFAIKRLRISSPSNNIVAFWIKTTGYYYFFKEKNK